MALPISQRIGDAHPQPCISQIGIETEVEAARAAMDEIGKALAPFVNQRGPAIHVKCDSAGTLVVAVDADRGAGLAQKSRLAPFQRLLDWADTFRDGDIENGA